MSGMSADFQEPDVKNHGPDMGLDELPRLVGARVARLVDAADADGRELVLRLLEIGFLPGEPVCVIAQGFPGHDPLAVRIGHTTFALRRYEAALIRVVPEQSLARGARVNAAYTAMAAPLRIALLGNPNCGKTALFNLLTGSRQKVANYAGVTVERKEGHLQTASGRRVLVLDLPGAYSLNPLSADEAVTRDVVTGRRAQEPLPDLLVCVVDATNLRLNLRLVLEARALGLPMVLTLNMSDMAVREGIVIDRGLLSRELAMPVLETVGVQARWGAEIAGVSEPGRPRRYCRPSGRRLDAATLACVRRGAGDYHPAGGAAHSGGGREGAGGQPAH
jgi:Fe2+ transport system protein FeoA